MTKTIHMSLSVRGALRWPKQRLCGLVRNTVTDKPLSAEAVREWLFDQLAAGIEVLPIGPGCEGFDPKNGCPGHPQIIQQNDDYSEGTTRE